jgi:chemotaxis protein CheD
VIAPAAAAIAFEPSRHFLHWGQLVVDASGASLVTIVGSCVAVCLWDSAHRVGGMSHYLLPEAPLAQARPAKPWSYGDLALPELMRQLEAIGSAPSFITARVFGGAAIANRNDTRGPGARNAAFARDWLAGRGIKVVAQDLGGRRGRNLVFDTDTGEVAVRAL